MLEIGGDGGDALLEGLSRFGWNDWTAWDVVLTVNNDHGKPTGQGPLASESHPLHPHYPHHLLLDAVAGRAGSSLVSIQPIE
jgi:hypothetical protein